MIGHKNPDEVTTALTGALEENTPDASLSIAEQVDWFMEHQNLTQKDAIKAVAKHLGLKKQEVYKEIHA